MTVNRGGYLIGCFYVRFAILKEFMIHKAAYNASTNELHAHRSYGPMKSSVHTGVVVQFHL